VKSPDNSARGAFLSGKPEKIRVTFFEVSQYPCARPLDAPTHWHHRLKGQKSLETPCVDICHLDKATGLCEGCGRTGDEIASWIKFTDADRRAIMAILPLRLEKLARTRSSMATAPE
jgi:uncharacterized protein